MALNGKPWACAARRWPQATLPALISCTEANAGTGEDDYGDRMQALLREQRECDDAGKNRDASDERPI